VPALAVALFLRQNAQMHWIEDKLVSDDILEEFFACELTACKGACCWEGSYGAPLLDSELDDVAAAAKLLRDELPDENQRILDKTKGYEWYDDMDKFGTALRRDGACVFLTFDKTGIGQCAIEQAWRMGRTSFRKPISCHLYPIRVQHQEPTGMTALNYDRWSICSAACQKGKRERIPLYRFAKEAIIRAFGHDFYEALEHAATRSATEEE